MIAKRKCPHCHGEGLDQHGTCPMCGGSGVARDFRGEVEHMRKLLGLSTRRRLREVKGT